MSPLLGLWGLQWGREREKRKLEGAQPSWFRQSSEEPAVTSGKLGLPPGGEEVRALQRSLRRLPCPSLPPGVCPGCAEHRIYSKCCHQWKLSEGARKRARGRDQHSRPPVPVLPTPPTPPGLSTVSSSLSVKRGCPASGMCPETTKMVIEPHLAEAAASGSDSWHPTPLPPHFRVGGFLCTYLGTFSSSEPHTGNARLKLCVITSGPL